MGGDSLRESSVADILATYYAKSPCVLCRRPEQTYPSAETSHCNQVDSPDPCGRTILAGHGAEDYMDTAEDPDLGDTADEGGSPDFWDIGVEVHGFRDFGWSWNAGSEVHQHVRMGL